LAVWVSDTPHVDHEPVAGLVELLAQAEGVGVERSRLAHGHRATLSGGDMRRDGFDWRSAGSAQLLSAWYP
jgi:hypothetical protein